MLQAMSSVCLMAGASAAVENQRLLGGTGWVLPTASCPLFFRSSFIGVEARNEAGNSMLEARERREQQLPVFFTAYCRLPTATGVEVGGRAATSVSPTVILNKIVFFVFICDSRG